MNGILKMMKTELELFVEETLRRIEETKARQGKGVYYFSRQFKERKTPYLAKTFFEEQGYRVKVEQCKCPNKLVDWFLDI